MHAHAISVSFPCVDLSKLGSPESSNNQIEANESSRSFCIYTWCNTTQLNHNINIPKNQSYETDFYYYLDCCEHCLCSYGTIADLLEWYCWQRVCWFGNASRSVLNQHAGTVSWSGRTHEYRQRGFRWSVYQTDGRYLLDWFYQSRHYHLAWVGTYRL